MQSDLKILSEVIPNNVLASHSRAQFAEEVLADVSGRVQSHFARLTFGDRVRLKMSRDRFIKAAINRWLH